MWAYVLAFLAITVPIGVLAVYFAYREGRPGAANRQSALPSRYSPEAYVADPAKVPGRCPECHADNDPSFEFCENCAAELPDVEATDGRSSLRELFGTR